MHTWGSEKTIDESFEADAYVIRQEVDGKQRIYVGKDKLHAKQLENWGASAQAANMDIGINDRYEIGPDGKLQYMLYMKDYGIRRQHGRQK